MKAERIDLKSKKIYRIRDKKRKIRKANCSTWKKWYIVGIGDEDIRDGNKKYILVIIWQMMKAHSLEVIGNKTE